MPRLRPAQCRSACLILAPSRRPKCQPQHVMGSHAWASSILGPHPYIVAPRWRTFGPTYHFAWCLTSTMVVLGPIPLLHWPERHPPALARGTPPLPPEKKTQIYCVLARMKSCRMPKQWPWRFCCSYACSQTRDLFCGIYLGGMSTGRMPNT